MPRSGNGRTLPDEVTTTWGASALKVRGKLFACVAINKSAEPNSMVVRMDMAQRNLLIEEDPASYYLTDHYVDYPCVVVRLSRISREALDDLIRCPPVCQRDRTREAALVSLAPPHGVHEETLDA